MGVNQQQKMRLQRIQLERERIQRRQEELMRQVTHAKVVISSFLFTHTLSYLAILQLIHDYIYVSFFEWAWGGG